MDRRRFIGASGAMAAAATVGGWIGAPGTAEAAARIPVTLTAGSGNGTANRLALQSAASGAQPGDVLELPAGTYEVDITGGSISLVRSISIVGAGQTATILDVLPKAPTTALTPLFDVATTAPDGSAFLLQDLTVQGTTTGVNAGSSCAIRWSRSGSVGRLRLERVTITGLFDSGVQRSGKGRFEIIDCDINAYEAPVKAFESTDSAGEAECIIINGLHTGFDSKSTSIGIYIHPNVSFLCSGTHYKNFSRFAFYANGTPGNDPKYFTVTDVEVEDCSLAQTASGASPVFVRVFHHGVNPAGGEGLIKGDVTFVDCDLRPSGSTGLMQGPHEITYVNCWIEPQRIFLSAGVNTSGTFRFINCHWKLENIDARALNLTGGWSGRLVFLDSVINDCGTTSGPYLLQINGGTVDFESLTIDTPRSNHGLTIGSGVTVNGAPTYLNTGSCPTSP